MMATLEINELMEVTGEITCTQPNTTFSTFRRYTAKN